MYLKMLDKIISQINTKKFAYELVHIVSSFLLEYGNPKYHEPYGPFPLSAHVIYSILKGPLT